MDLHAAVRIIFILSCALSASTAVSKRRWSGFSQRALYCSTPGQVICKSDCSEVQMCVGDGNGGLVAQPMIECDVASGFVCSAVARNCVPKADSECQVPGNAFTCYDLGSYPDPYDCRTYHVCTQVGELALTVNCTGAGTAYNPLTADCSLDTSARVCTEGPVKRCQNSLEVGVVPENPAIYYICKPGVDGLYPEMHRCPGGKVYDVELYECVESSTASPPVTPTDSPTEPQPPTETPTGTPPSPPPTSSPSPGGPCSEPGEKIANPQDCYSYFECLGTTWLQVYCIVGFHYDQQKEICVEGSCPYHRG